MVAERVEIAIIAAPAGGLTRYPAPAFDGTQPCMQFDPELWHDSYSTTIAKRYCRQCPFMIECQEYAIPRAWLTGVWGGLSKHQRNTIRLSRDQAPIRQEWIAGEMDNPPGKP